MERALIGWPGQTTAAAHSFDEILIHLIDLL